MSASVCTAAGASSPVAARRARSAGTRGFARAGLERCAWPDLRPAPARLDGAVTRERFAKAPVRRQPRGVALQRLAQGGRGDDLLERDKRIDRAKRPREVPSRVELAGIGLAEMEVVGEPYERVGQQQLAVGLVQSGRGAAREPADRGSVIVPRVEAVASALLYRRGERPVPSRARPCRAETPSLVERRDEPARRDLRAVDPYRPLSA